MKRKFKVIICCQLQKDVMLTVKILFQNECISGKRNGKDRK